MGSGHLRRVIQDQRQEALADRLDMLSLRAADGSPFLAFLPLRLVEVQACVRERITHYKHTQDKASLHVSKSANPRPVRGCHMCFSTSCSVLCGVSGVRGPGDGPDYTGLTLLEPLLQVH